MRVVLIVLLGCIWMPVAWAKTMAVPKGTINVNQLHDELLARFPVWQGTQQPDGTFTDSLLRVEHTDREIRLTVPEDADEAAVQAVIRAHTPKPPKDAKALKKSAKKKLKDLGLTQDEVDVVMSD